MDFPFPLRHRFKRGDCLRLLESVLRVSEGKRTPVLSLLLRLGGDLGGWPDARRVGGLLNGLAILIFLLLIARALHAGLGAE
jgi:hypothetical protein